MRNAGFHFPSNCLCLLFLFIFSLSLSINFFFLVFHFSFLLFFILRLKLTTGGKRTLAPYPRRSHLTHAFSNVRYCRHIESFISFFLMKVPPPPHNARYHLFRFLSNVHIKKKKRKITYHTTSCRLFFSLLNSGYIRVKKKEKLCI